MAAEACADKAGTGVVVANSNEGMGVGDVKVELGDGAKPPAKRSLGARLVLMLGPGLMACLADTDGPCLITAAQSGANWSYSLLLLQAVLIPILFFAQELAARLGIVTGKGMTEMLRKEIGPKTAWAVSVPLLLACSLGLLSEYMIIGKTMALWGVSIWVTNLVITTTLFSIVATGSYWVAESVGLTMGVCQVIFFVTMFIARPEAQEMQDTIARFPMGDSDYIKLITANIGAVIMPWMLCYQQSAICNKGVHEDTMQHVKFSRIDTWIGCFLTQGVMAAMLISVAAAHGEEVESMDDLHQIFTQILGGEERSRWILTFAVIGPSMIAAIVQSLGAAWTLQQAMGRETATLRASTEMFVSWRSWAEATRRNIRERPIFYVMYVLCCTAAFVLTLVLPETDSIAVMAQFCNGILMPPIVFSMWYLSAYKLPVEYRMGCVYKWLVFFVFLVVSGFCLVSIFFSFTG